MQFAAVSDIGRLRKINEDSYFVNKDEKFPYAVVADGMGGLQAGEIASSMAINHICRYMTDMFDASMDYVEAGELMRRAFLKANSEVFSYADRHYSLIGMGTTTTMAAIYKGKIITANVGDSRTYAIGEKEIRQLTKDHSYVQELVSLGKLTQEEARTHPKRNYITRAIGAEETVKADISIKPYKGEKIFLCSDGLTGYISDEVIMKYMNKKGTLQANAQKLVDLANSKGGRDNITIAVLEGEKSV